MDQAVTPTRVAGTESHDPQPISWRNDASPLAPAVADRRDARCRRRGLRTRGAGPCRRVHRVRLLESRRRPLDGRLEPLRGGLRRQPRHVLPLRRPGLRRARGRRPARGGRRLALSRAARRRHREPAVGRLGVLRAGQRARELHRPARHPDQGLREHRRGPELHGRDGARGAHRHDPVRVGRRRAAPRLRQPGQLVRGAGAPRHGQPAGASGSRTPRFPPAAPRAARSSRRATSTASPASR